MRSLICSKRERDILQRRLISDAEINESETDNNEQYDRSNDDSNILHDPVNNSPNSVGRASSSGGVALTATCDYSPQSIYANYVPVESQLRQYSMDQDEKDRSVDLSSNNTRSSGNSDIIESSSSTSDTRGTSVQQPSKIDYNTWRSAVDMFQAIYMNWQRENDNAPVGQGQRAERPRDTKQPGAPAARLNSQGKRKMWPCKKCAFVGNVKQDLWEHSIIHIKSGKILYCHKCTFITEYKHHLEYHLRNHAGSKPFKCIECKYKCVNKSMLNSHMKSHSKVYPYKCSNCAYATKYCHSLKLHLRKYGHTPAPMLNPDGTSNDECYYIDVYGTKRGPKRKPKTYAKTHDQPVDISNNNNNNNNGNAEPNVVVAQIAPVAQVAPVAPVQPAASTASSSKTSDVDQATQNDLGRGTSLYSQLLAAFNLPNQFLFYEETETRGETSRAAVQETRVSHESEPELLLGSSPRPANNDTHTVDLATANDAMMIDDGTDAAVSFPTFAANGPSPRPRGAENDGNQRNPLDLTIRYPGTDGQLIGECQSTGSSPRFSGTRRRKGIAVKLKRVSQEPRTTGAASDEEKKPGKEKLGNFSTAGPLNIREAKPSAGSSNDLSVNLPCFYCTHCEITFRSECMYLSHVTYHGKNDPFRCSLCNEKYNDSASFFSHINVCLVSCILRTNDAQDCTVRSASGLRQFFHFTH